MIQNALNKPKTVKAVGLLSGGLDSTLAAQVIRDLGIEVHGAYFAMPWGCCDKNKAAEAAERLGIKFVVFQLDERYLEVVKKPKYGYGSAMNPCVDCRIHMFSRAAQYMREIEADFVFTGEVLGQRPMSQLKHSMKRIEEGAGLSGKLLRPLSAQLLEPTQIERDGLIDRNKLLSICGRARHQQIELAREFNVTSYRQPAGGCLLTEKDFARRMKDIFQHGYQNFRETIALKWGKHFRISKNFKAILGRDEEENLSLEAFAHQDDFIMRLADQEGPSLILKGYNPSDDVLSTCAALIQRNSKYKNEPAHRIQYWNTRDKNNIKFIQAKTLTDEEIEGMRI